ncbi:hypothetical protein AAG570_000280 [Ranatra chinensis]|uniref:Glycogen debranching enzyme n=1 Tax=Ranatra chinensis TaxID=642074 RepID=A0ABD0ZHU2_9HEMI
MLSICDIVLNHSANESEWLGEHPECGYNLNNSPHLRPAYLLDWALHTFSNDVAKGLYEISGIPPNISTEDHLQAIKHILTAKILPEMKIPELYMVDVVALVLEFQTKCQSGVKEPGVTAITPVRIIQDPEFRRLKSTVDMKLALENYNVFRNDCFDEDTRQRKCAESFKARLEELNDSIRREVEEHLSAAVENCIRTIHYFRIQSDGPKIKEITKQHPLFPRYFVEKSGKGGEDTFYADAKSASLIMAHNGWVMNHDPLINFAEPGSNVYLRRELIAWGDSVKLRYGESEVDCPYLWNYMREYVETTASIFDGVRLDNCHSTPIPLAQYLLDAARKVKPNLYVVAELFTNSDKTDNIFVNKLGITSLIREALSAWDCHEEGRLVYRYGGQPVGSFSGEVTGSAANAHALFLDMTHDNPSPVQKRTLFDMLPSAALVSMAACASGTTMGYDQLVPHHVMFNSHYQMYKYIHVVDEKRQYMGKDRADLSCGISAGKLALNELHSWLSKNNFNQVFVDQVDQDIVCVTRHNEKNLDSVILFSYTAFQWPRTDVSALGKSIVVHGCVTRVIFEAYLTHGVKNFKEDDKVINGLEEYKLQIKKDLQVNNSAMIEISDCGGGATRISLTSKFLPGSVIALRVSATEKAKKAVISLVNGVNNITKEVLPLNLADLNYALYTCSEEEESGGAYNIPNFGALVYCGIQGIMSVLDGIAAKDDLGHALCANIRDGPWLSDYTIRRFRAHKSTKKLGKITYFVKKDKKRSLL